MNNHNRRQNKCTYVITEDEAYELDLMLNLISLTFWNMIEKGKINKENVTSLRTQFSKQVYKYINQP